MKIVCFGGSLTSCGGENGRFSDILQERFPGHEFINRGVGSDTFVEALERLDADVLRSSLTTCSLCRFLDGRCGPHSPGTGPQARPGPLAEPLKASTAGCDTVLVRQYL